MRRALASWLGRQRRKTAELDTLAALIGVSTRTLRNWKCRGGEQRRPGRRGHAAEERARAFELVRERFEKLPGGHDGSRSVRAALERDGIVVATRLVQASVRELKRERAARERQRIEARREEVEVLVRDAVWGADETFVCRDEQGATWASIVRETMVPRTLSMAIGPSVTGRELEQQLERAAEERGGWPLVLMLDNGGANRERHLQERLAREQVIVMWNLPHTPQHNPRTERGHGDLKRAMAADELARADADPLQDRVSSSEPGVARMKGRARRPACASTSRVARLVDTWARLDEQTPREGLCALTPAELDRLAPRADACVCRAGFYARLRDEMERACAACATRREARMAERNAIWNALQRAGLLTRTRGGRPVLASIEEGVS